MDAAWIPFGQLAERMAELPPKSEAINLVHLGDYRRAKALLEGGGRRVNLVEPKLGRSIPGRLWEPNAFLHDCLTSITPSTALDLACGSGREVAALAGSRWRVSGIDILPDGLERARSLASHHLSEDEASSIAWIQRDLLQNGIPSGRWDLVTMFFFLDRHLLDSITGAIHPGGSFIMETFLEENFRVFGKPKSPHLFLKQGELPSLFPGAEIVRYEEGLHGDRYTARGWFRF